MGTLSPEIPRNNWERVMENLINGRDLANQLHILLQNPNGDNGSVAAEEIALKILRSFNETLSVLNSCDSGEICRIPAISQVGSPGSGDRRTADSGQSSKRPAVKDGRGCYKRRKKTDSWVTVSPSMEDGQSWRKYGQKEILNSKFPKRCYFRCTYKHGQGCRATKQVQIIQEEPQIFQTTYFGHHTCTNHVHPLGGPQEISDSDHLESNGVGFESEISTVPPPMEKEDSNFWTDLMPLDSHGDESVISSAYNSFASAIDHGLDMDFFIESGDFENSFHFDEAELF